MATPVEGDVAELTRSQRLDRLPFTAKHAKLLTGSGVGWALDAMDVGLISYVMLALKVQWHLDPTTLSWIGSIGFVGMALGATLGGLLADRIGRRQVFAITLLIYGLATGAAALSISVAMLIVLRFIVGLGLGAELPVASTLVSEFAPKRIRGRVVVALEAFWAVGWLIAALIGYLLIPNVTEGWRWALAIGVVPTVYAAVVRWGLPESVRFLEHKGRFAEAEEVVVGFEQAAQVAPVPSPNVAPSKSSGEVSIWSAELRRRTIALWAVWFFINLSYYGAFIWLPSLLKDRFSLTVTLTYALIITIAQLPGYAAAAYLVEKWGRRPTLATFLLGSAISAALFGFAGSEAEVLAAGCALSFFNLGAWGALYAIGPEIYPTGIRGTGTGAAAAFGRIASIIAPLSVPLLLSGGGLPMVFTVFGVAFLLAAGAALLLPERRNQPLAD
ncbi:MFS transporter [Propionicimonas sp.]|uniref:MFS transporter n=1 Tax=Propionicimonas sp. TaxID=1955623 RepID=UPI001857F1E7|nr:MFS transporter [Propionicimonas sp.]MBU3975994.1 MFS transporter [Actinomycetota bacterium]MBA3020808.1 MFS transporter [Propionicimonas sp.]MBU3985184.1 MFS transporter [Actinomycetota bacterium]MBU4008174.1 MFS transporter [Actinomycetota bacterium]MBU4064612.1 MFS transporter [Actinomycetota bacterium]